ncbi:MAG: iron chelate uptake ABC transporter family permease subunit [Phycisphaerales bacterium]
MDEFFRLITLQDANTRVVLLGATVLGIASAVVGSFAVLRKRSLVGDAVAHAALPGVCAAYFVVGERDFGAFMIGATIFGVLASAFVSAVKQWTRVKEDAAIAMAIGGFFGLGIVMSRIIQNDPGGNRAGLDGFIFGKAASMVRSDAWLILGVACGCLALVALLYKELKLLCFDREFAAGQGWPTFALDLVLMTLVCACTVVGLPAVGVVLMVALLVLPAVAARFWTERLGVMLVLAGIFGGFSGLMGTVVSAAAPAPGAGGLSRGWPTGPLIVLTAALIFTASMLLAPGRGLIADMLRRASLRRRIGTQNLLRDAYEWLEPGQDLGRAWTEHAVARGGRFPGGVIKRALRDGLIAPASDGTVLTAEGQAAAARVVRAHRLWELYLIEQADIAADHVDRDADQIEHVLPAQVISQLEAKLAEEGRLPLVGALIKTVPASPHPIGVSTAKRVILLALAAMLIGGLPDRASARELRSADDATRTTAGSVLGDSGADLADGLSDGTDAGPRSGRHQWHDASVSDPMTTSRPLAHARGSVVMPAADRPTPDVPRVWFRVGSYEVRNEDLWTCGTAVVCSVSCGVLGCFLVLRRMSLLGDAISHAILPGLAAAFILTGSREPWAMLGGAMIVGVLTALLSSGLSRWGKVPEDASMGVVFTTLFALGVVLITLVASDVDLDPGCVLYGLIEFVPFDTVSLLGFDVPRTFVWLSVMLVVNIGLITAFYKELKIVCFDPYLATTMGISATAVHYALMTTVAATSVASFEAVGSILVIAMLIAPGATAQLLTDRLARMLWWSAAIGAACAVGGYALAVRLDTSVAGMIAAVALGIFCAAALFAPRHGVIARRVLARRFPAAPLLSDPR